MNQKNNKLQAVIDGEQRFRELAEMLPQTIFELDLNANFTYTNRFGFESTGYTQDDIDSGLNALQLFSPGDRERARENIARILSGGELKPHEYTVMRKDGGTFPVLIYTRPIVRNGNPVGLRGVVVDITERKIAEEAQKKAHDELEKRVGERTDELTDANRRLQEQMENLKKVERALRDSEDQYRSFLSKFRGIAYRGKMDFTPLFFHGAVEEITGYTEKEFISGEIKWNDVIHPKDLTGIAGMYEVKCKPDYSVLREYRIIRRDGEIRWIQEFIQNVCGDDGKPLYVQGIVYDITKRKQAEDALKKSEAKYRGLFENILDGVYQTKPDGAILSANPALVKMLGYDSEEDLLKIGLAQNLYVNPIDRKELTQKLDKDGELRNVEFRLRCKDGREITVLENARAILDEEGRISHYEGVLTDITRRKQAEKALQDREEHFRNFLENLGDIAYAIDTRQIITYTNKMGEIVVGLPRSKIVGKSFLPLFTEESQKLALDVYKQTLNGGSPEYELVFLNGKICRFKNEPLRDKDGKITGVFGTARDITDQKKADLALRDAHEQLNATLNALPDLLFEVDINGKIIDFRAPHPGLLFRPPEEFLGQRVDEVLPREASRIIMAAIKEAARKKQSRGKVYSLKMHGETRWFELSVAIKGDPESPGRHFIAMAHDLTDRRQAEIALRESEERYRLLIDSSDYAITLLAKDGTILLINKTGARNLSRKPDDIIGKSIREFLPDSFEEIQKRNQKILKSGKGQEFEDLLELPAGKRWFWSNLQVVKDASGHEVGIQIISHDITVRKQNEELLKQKTEELREERKALTEKNIALKEILAHIEKERQDYKQNICRDVEQVTTSVLKRLKPKVGPAGAKDIETLETELNIMLARDIDIFKDRYDRLTSRESEICDMIKEGRSSKQISEELNLSILTIQKHREQIRKKLGITNKGINLATYLRSH